MSSDRHARPRTPFLIGVAGGSNSGKTTLARRLLEMTGSPELGLVQLDSYYQHWVDTPLDVRAAANYDHPDAFDWPLIIEHLDLLRHGDSVPVPVYDFVDFNRTERTTVLKPGPVIVVEGILVLADPEMRSRLDLKVFVDAPADLRLIRRLARDVAERGRSTESIIDQYLTTVRPSHEFFVEPSKRYADVIIPEGGHNLAAMEMLRARILELLAGTQPRRHE